MARDRAGGPGQLQPIVLDYLFITNADQDHMSDLKGLEDAGIYVDSKRPPYALLKPDHCMSTIA